jgi:hypothetical protein
MKRTLCYALPAVLAAVAGADTINPSSVSATLDVGESLTITKTVTVSTELTTALVDVFFLVDTTGSMGGEITAVKNAISTIFTNTSALGDIAYGVGQYEDFYTGFETRGWGSPGDVPWAMLQDLTTDTTAVTNGINALALGSGNDGPESNFEGLKQMADTASWRPGSKRIAFWFGDARSHDPDDTSGYPGPTQADTIAALNAKNIQVEALNSGGLDSQGEATAVTAATGGALRTFSSDATALINIVKDALDTTFSTYKTVALDLSEVPGGLAAVSNPGAYAGAFSRDVEETFEFDLTITALTPGTYDFNIYGLVDGVRTAREIDRIIVPGDGAIPEPSMGVFGGMALLLGFLGFRRHRR